MLLVDFDFLMGKRIEIDVVRTSWIPRFTVAAVFLCLYLQASVLVQAGDTISINQSLSGDQTTISANGVFELGFFAPGTSLNYYIGIWYKEVSPRTVVWVANREKPVSDRFSSVLKISDNNLVLFNESRIPIWSTDVNPKTSAVTKAVLLNKGNLVLYVNGFNEPLWQSFDHPTNTFLAGAKIGKSGKNNIFLTSWKSSEDPAPGDYSLEQFLIGSEVYFVTRKRSSSSEISWSTGNWNGKTFSSVPEMRLNYIFNYSYVSNTNDSYFTYDIYSKYTFSTWFMIDVLGQLKMMNWLTDSGWNIYWTQPRRICEVYALCGAYGSCIQKNPQLPCRCLFGFESKSPYEWNLTDYSGGCRRKTELQCHNRERFTKNPGMSISGAKKSVQAQDTGECESICLNDCSCTAFAYESNSCFLWNGDLMDLKQLEPSDSRGITLNVRLATSEFPSPKTDSGASIYIVAGSVFGFAGLLGLVAFLVLRRRKKMARAGESMEGSLVAFEYRDLQNATNNFTEKLGGGGFGSVFKGTLPDSTIIAVKQLESISQGEKQFRAEVRTIGTIQHVNLVRLLGLCSQGSKKLLVYDYMPNGSLASNLFENRSCTILNWKTRYQIALGTARGLCYLHEECRECIIHCDIKPDNVLLDAEFCPKVADFGLAKLVGRDFSRVLTTMRGTRGYLAPEWLSGVAITAKADVFSFGMMLFELISGRRNSSYYIEGEVSFFPIFAASIIIEGGDVLSLLDSRLEGSDDLEEVIRVCRVACWCIQYEEAQRPSMGQIVQILEGLIDVDLPPFPRLFQAFVGHPNEIISSTESSSSSKSLPAGKDMSVATFGVESTESSSLLKF